MKLIIGGSTGFVGTELVRQALSNPAVTSIVGLSRRETSVPAGSTDPTNKLKSVVCEDFERYPDTLKKELENADACIWTIAITPSKLKSSPWEETVKVCRNYTLTALEALMTIPRQQTDPLRFLYISGHFAPRDRSEIPPAIVNKDIAELALLRGKLGDEILALSAKSNGSVVSCIAKPGMILAPGMQRPDVPGLPKIALHDIALALLNQALDGFDKGTLSNDDMIRIAQNASVKQ
ncbi:hypothetical protein GGR56DRAFT_256474 [Xylariaceae sp. FL0804]|nr:hypothetical protein GGR56DRAFT_256474 [Xylariaceae sp. FL0804]